MTARHFVKYEDTLSEITLFETNQNLITFSINGDPVKEEVFLRAYDDPGGFTVFVIREKGLREGQLVRFKWKVDEFEKMVSEKDEIEKEFYEFFAGTKKWLTAIQGKLLTINSSRKYLMPVPSRTKKDDEEACEVHSFDVKGFEFPVKLPLDWVEPLSPEEQYRYELTDNIRIILNERSQKLAQEKSTIMERIIAAQDALTKANDQMQAYSARSLEDYIEKELNGLGRATETLKEDARIEVIENLDQGLKITTSFQVATVQNANGETPGGAKYFTLSNGKQLRIPIGRIKIEIKPNQNPYFYFLDRFEGADAYHPHQLGGGKLCYGTYGGIYTKALAAKDYYTCFQIAIEVLTNINPDSQTHGALELANRVLRNHGINETCGHSRDEAQKLLDKVLEEYGDIKVTPKKTNKKVKTHDKKLIASILKELNPNP